MQRAKAKPKKIKPEWQRHIYNYDMSEFRKKQNKFERYKMFSCSQLGFIDIDDLTTSVLDRMLNKITSNSPHRPNLFNENYKTGKIKYVNDL